MKILRKYITRELVTPILLALAVFTFILFTARFLKMADMVLNRGVSFGLILKLFIFMVVYIFKYTIPMALLSGSLLVFGRMSADNEICAMRASGISLLKIMRPALLLGVVVCGFCFFLHHYAIPFSRYHTRKTVTEITTQKPLAALEPGTFIETFSGCFLFFRTMEGNRIDDVIIYEPLPDKKITRVIMARYGEFLTEEDSGGVTLKLHQGSIDEPDPKSKGNSFRFDFEDYTTKLKMAEASSDLSNRKISEMLTHEFVSKIIKLKESGVNATFVIVEISKRFSLAFAPLFLLFAGLPLAIKTHRGDKSASFAMSLGLVVLNYIFLAWGEAMAQKGTLMGPVWVWLPNFAFLFLGFFFVYRAIYR